VKADEERAVSVLMRAEIILAGVTRVVMNQSRNNSLKENNSPRFVGDEVGARGAETKERTEKVGATS
jgi:hypothetical protein